MPTNVESNPYREESEPAVEQRTVPPYTCIFCGAPSWREPHDQELPPDYCHEEDHGTPEEYFED